MARNRHAPACVYRIFALDGELLYVGMSTNPFRRFAAHKSKSWGHLIDCASIEWYDDRETAKAAERSAIHHDGPTYNLARPDMGCC